MTAYQLAGLRIQSEISLDAAEVDAGGAEPDVDIRWARRPLGATPRGRLHGAFPTQQQPFYTVRRDERWWRLRYERAGIELRFDDAGRRMDVAVAREAERAFAPLLVAGNGIAFALELRGAMVLHASAVALDGRAIAFAGPMAVGKSTTATLACSGGAQLVADDLLHVVNGRGEVRCHPSGTTVRLRPDAQPLADHPSVLGSEETADERLSAKLPTVDGGPLPLAAIAVPRQYADADQVEIRPLTGAEALTVLLSARRFAGWTDPKRQASWLQRSADLTARVPVFAVAMPHGPSRAGLGEALTEQLRSAIAR